MDVWSPYVHNQFTIYCILDEESNSSFISSAFIDKVNPKNKMMHSYAIRTVNGPSLTPHEGRICRNLKIKGHGLNIWHKLPDMFELPTIPDSKDEVCTPADARAIPSLAPYAEEFLPLRDKARVMLLLGRDSGDLMATTTLTDHAPIVHRTPLGMAAVGGRSSAPERSGEASRALCTFKGLSADRMFSDPGRRYGLLPQAEDPLFQTRPDDEEEDLSVEDREFLQLINERLRINSSGRIEAPLPFKNKGKEPVLPDNSKAVYGRQLGHLRQYKKDPVLGPFCYEAMAKNIENGYVERIQESELQTAPGRCWYLPIFIATNKKGKPRLVFDSAAKFGPKGQEVCLNQTLMSGPDRNNQLRDVLLRFRMAVWASWLT